MAMVKVIAGVSGGKVAVKRQLGFHYLGQNDEPNFGHDMASNRARSTIAANFASYNCVGSCYGGGYGDRD